MSIDTSVSNDAPAAATDTLTDPDTDRTEHPQARPAGEPGEDGATTPGGPTMILLLTGIYVLVSWLRRRHRRRTSA
ncbi:MAG: hypothetical protein ABWY45_05965 [Mycobacterium sp.]